MCSWLDRRLLDICTGGPTPTGLELEQVRLHIADAGFDPARLLPADSRVVGLTRADGSRVNRGDLLLTAELHYLRHVARQQEWPIGTTQKQYENNLTQVAASMRVGILLREIAPFGWHVSMVGRSGLNQGPFGSP